jgi:hypothetical protein
VAQCAAIGLAGGERGAGVVEAGAGRKQRGVRRVEDGLGDEAAAQQVLVALLLDRREVEIRLRAGDAGAGRLHLLVEGLLLTPDGGAAGGKIPVVQRDEHLAGLHAVAHVGGDRNDGGGDARGKRDGHAGLHGAGTAHAHRDAARFHRGKGHAFGAQESPADEGRGEDDDGEGGAESDAAVAGRHGTPEAKGTAIIALLPGTQPRFAQTPGGILPRGTTAPRTPPPSRPSADRPRPR